MVHGRRVKHRLRISLVVAVLCLSSFGATGCTLVGSSIKIPGTDTRIGEWTIVRNGWLAVLYRNSGPGYFGASQFILDRYRLHRQEWTVQFSTLVTMAEAREGCARATGDPNNPGDKCRHALRDEEWKDFHDDSLIPIARDGGKCIAVQMNNNGTNWTTRISSDKHCRP
jgi:hypothetical protein